MSDRGVGEARLRSLCEAAGRVPFVVPKEVAAAVEILDHATALLADAGAQASESPGAAEERIAREAVPRLEAGDSLESIELEIAAGREAAELAELRVRVLREALDVLRTRAHGVLVEHANTIAASLQAALDKLMSEARKAAPGLKGCDSAEAAIRAGEAVSRTWRRLEEMAERYRALREAYGAVYRGVFEPQLSDPLAGRVSEFANLFDVLPNARSSEARPWSDAPPARLAWVASSRLRAWTPTAEQLAAAFERERASVKEAQAEQHRAILARAAAMRG